MTGDEAYARRLAMSQGRSAVAAVTTSIPEFSAPNPPAELGEEPYPLSVTTSQPQPFEEKELAYNPFAPPTSVPPPPAQSDIAPKEHDEKFQERVKTSREAAAAVAARLALAAASAQENTPSEPEETAPAPSKKSATRTVL